MAERAEEPPRQKRGRVDDEDGETREGKLVESDGNASIGIED
jgi:hypothetical protein